MCEIKNGLSLDRMLLHMSVQHTYSRVGSPLSSSRIIFRPDIFKLNIPKEVNPSRRNGGGGQEGRQLISLFFQRYVSVTVFLIRISQVGKGTFLSEFLA